MSNENLYLYILVRNDLPSMGAGRAAAQASHAANAFWKKYGSTPEALEWSRQTPQGFGTAIVLSVNEFDLYEKLTECGEAGFPNEAITDPDYVIPVSSEIVPFLNRDDHRITVEQSPTDPARSFIHRSEITCGYVFGDKEKLAPFLSGFPLYS